MVWGVSWVIFVACDCSLTLSSGLLGRVSFCALAWQWASWCHRPPRQVEYVSWFFVDGNRYKRCVSQLYYLTYRLSSPRSRNILCWIVGCRFSRVFVFG